MSSVGAVVTDLVASLFLTDSTLVSLLSTWSWANNKQIDPDLSGQLQSVMLTSMVSTMTKCGLGFCLTDDVSDNAIVRSGRNIFGSDRKVSHVVTLPIYKR